MKQLLILGPGCKKCETLYHHTEDAAKAIGLDYSIQKVTDIQEMMKFKIMSTPALVVDGVVHVAGRVPDVAQLQVLVRPGAPQKWVLIMNSRLM